jgi:hypothetical protein
LGTGKELGAGKEGAGSVGYGPVETATDDSATRAQIQAYCAVGQRGKTRDAMWESHFL